MKIDDVDVVDVNELVQDNTTKYGKSQIISTLPSEIDGLKQVHRRILFSMGTDSGRDKCATFNGTIMSLYHPHGDGTIHDSMTRLMQPWNVPFVLIQGCGNYGAYSGETPAAMRYLEAYTAPAAIDIFFKTNPRVLKMVRAETDKAGIFEPVYMVPRIPMAALVHTVGIGVGYSTRIIPIGIREAYELTRLVIASLKLTGKKKREMTDKFCNYTMPEFHTKCLIRNSRQLRAAHAERNFSHPVVVDGVMELAPNTITIITLPPMIKFKALDAIMIKEIKNNQSYLAKKCISAKDLDDNTIPDTEARYKIVLRRNVDPFSVLEYLNNKVRFSRKYHPNYTFGNEFGEIVKHNPVTLIKRWYTARRKTIISEIRYKQAAIVEAISRNGALLVVADHYDAIIRIIKQSDNKDLAAIAISKQFDLTRTQAGYICSLELSVLTKQSRQDLFAKRDALKQQLDAINDMYLHVDDIILDDLTFFEKNYVRDRSAMLPDFKGVLQVTPIGHIQYRNTSELEKLVKIWGKDNVTIKPYPPHTRTIYSMYNDELDTNTEMDFPMHIVANDVRATTETCRYTIIQKKVGNSYKHFVIKGLSKNTQQADDLWYVGKSCTIVERTGVVRTGKTTELFTVRKSAASQGVKATKSQIFSVTGDNLVVVYFRTGIKNSCFVERIVPGKKLRASPTGELIVAAIVKDGQQAMFTIPKEALNRCQIKHLCIPDVSKLLKKNAYVTIELNRKRASNGDTFAPSKRAGAIFYHKEK